MKKRNLDYIKLSKSFINILRKMNIENLETKLNLNEQDLRNNFISFLKENNIELINNNDCLYIEELIFIEEKKIFSKIKEELEYFWEERLENYVIEELYELKDNNRIFNSMMKKYNK